jgi:molybdopterin molybdotransferase
MLNYDEALRLIENEFRLIPKNITEVDLLESTGLTLAEDIYADSDLPAFDYSGMDGYAIKYSGNISNWKITGEISAGNFKQYPLDESSAVRIMTGGRIPTDADTVIPIEDVFESENIVTLRNDVKIKQLQNIRYKGEDLKMGSVAIPSGTIVSPHNISLAASCGKTKLKVYEILSVGVMTTGDELIDISKSPVEDKVRASNPWSLLALIKEMKLLAVNLGIVKDNKELLQNAVSSFLNSDIDILITTGGVSVGKYDYLKDIFNESGVETIFWRVNIKPGKPLYFGKYVNGNKIKLIFGLPGNPVSSFVNFILFIKPAIQKYYGNDSFGNYPAILKSPLRKKDSKRHFVRGQMSYDSAAKKYYVQESGTRSSGNLAGLGMSNCLIVIPENITNPEAGDLVECIKI